MDQGHARRLGRRELTGIGAAVVLAVLGTVAFLALRSDGPAVITLASAGAGGEFAATAEADDAAAPRADMMMWAPVEHRFELRDSARFDAGEATAWQLRAPGDVQAAARDLADHFGLDEVRSAPYGDGSLVAGADDGSGPSLWVSAAGDWFYSAPNDLVLWDCVEPALPEDPAAEGEAAGSEGAPDEPTQDDIDARELVTPACEPPTPPSGVPSAAEARQLAAALFADLDVPGEVVVDSAEADDWGAWVQGTLVLDGVPADLFVYANWGGDAELMSAGGTLATPTRMDTYPTIDADQAVVRLGEQMSGWAAAGRPEPLPMPTDDTTQAAPTVTDPDEPVSSDTLPADDPLVTTPLPAPEGGELEVVTVTLVAAEPVLMLQPDAGGALWLLPGYRFTDQDGGIWQVLAIADEYVETEEPGGEEPGGEEPEPLDPDEPSQGGTEPGSGGVVDPEPGGGSPGSPGEGGEPEPGIGEGEPGEIPNVSAEVQRAAESVIGMSEEEATATIEAAGGEVRLVARDGEHFAVTDDFRPHRVNLTIEGGVVTETSLG